MSLLVVKVGGAVAGASAQAVLELAREHDVCVVHGAGPQISVEMERAGIPVSFRDGLRVTTPEAITIVRASLEAVNAALCAGIGVRAARLFGDEIGLEALAIPGLGLVGEASHACPPAIAAALERGAIPVVAPIAVGPLNVNADQAAAALAIGMQAERLLFLTDVAGLILEGEVVETIELAAAAELLSGGTLEGGIIPKLGAALEAARCGVPAWIGATELRAEPSNREGEQRVGSAPSRADLNGAAAS